MQADPDLEAQNVGASVRTRGAAGRIRSLWWYASRNTQVSLGVSPSDEDSTVQLGTNKSSTGGSEKQPGDDPREVTSELRMKACSLMFGLPRDHARLRSGATLYCELIEQRLESLRHEAYNGLWKFCGLTTPAKMADCWTWFCSVLEASHHYRDDPDGSIEKIFKRLQVGLERQSNTSPQSVDKDRVLLAIFAVLCWSSLAYTPELHLAERNTANSRRQLTLKVAELVDSLELSDTSRPLSKMFREFRVFEQRDQNPMANRTNVENDLIFESSINISGLQAIGRVRLEWVDNLTAHLKFDRHTRTLHVFRLPSFCAMNIRRTRSISAIDIILSVCFSTGETRRCPTFDSNELHREVLLTYRLLFGQSQSSRKLAKRLIINHGKDHGGSNDPLLEDMCNTTLPSSLFPPELDPNGVLISRDSYSACDDFPFFGSRLLALQDYNLKQQPSRVYDLWRDRRNPPQWYTFWAVLFLGGLSVVIAILQLGISGGQLYYAMRPVQ